MWPMLEAVKHDLATGVCLRPKKRKKRRATANRVCSMPIGHNVEDDSVDFYLRQIAKLPSNLGFERRRHVVKREYDWNLSS